MAYGMGGGNRNYDPSLKGLPSNSFVGIDGELSDVEVADLTPDDGGGANSEVIPGMLGVLLSLKLFQPS